MVKAVKRVELPSMAGKYFQHRTPFAPSSPLKLAGTVLTSPRAGSLMNNKNTHQIRVIEQAGPNNQVQIVNLGSGTAIYCSYQPSEHSSPFRSHKFAKQPSESTSRKALGGPTQVNSYSKVIFPLFHINTSLTRTFPVLRKSKWRWFLHVGSLFLPAQNS
jgi:hypothetical protein